MSKRNKLTQDEIDDLTAEVTGLLNDGGTHTKEFWKAYIKRDRRRRLDAPSAGSDRLGGPEPLEQAISFRALASWARGLVRSNGGQDTTRILALVAELEERAATLEKRKPGQCQCV